MDLWKANVEIPHMFFFSKQYGADQTTIITMIPLIVLVGDI